MFIVDLLHEFELGVWKAVFTHLMRVLYAAGGDCIQKLNERFVNLNLLVLRIVDARLSGTGKCLPLVEIPYVGFAEMLRE